MFRYLSWPRGGHKTKFGHNAKMQKYSPGSVYGASYTQFHQFREKLLQKKHPQGRNVAERILWLATTINPPFRLQVGGDAVFSRLIMRFLPSNFRLKLQGKMLAAGFNKIAKTAFVNNVGMES